jgi:hypothetical protein
LIVVSLATRLLMNEIACASDLKRCYKIVSTMPAKEGHPFGRIEPSIQTGCCQRGKTIPPRDGPHDTAVQRDRRLALFTDHIAEAEARFAKVYSMNAPPLQNQNRRFILASK